MQAAPAKRRRSLISTLDLNLHFDANYTILYSQQERRASRSDSHPTTSHAERRRGDEGETSKIVHSPACSARVQKVIAARTTLVESTAVAIRKEFLKI